MSLHGEVYERRLVMRHRMGLAFEWMCRLATMSALAMLLVLLGSIVVTVLRPGRGSGLVPVSLSSNVKNEERLTYKVANVLGGQFEFKDDPETRIRSFTNEDLRSGRVVFNHDGKRATPIFDLAISNADQEVAKLAGVTESTQSDFSLPIAGSAPPAKPHGWLTWDFLTHYNNYDPMEAGIMAGLWGSIWLMVLTAIMSVPLGVGAAVYLEEYSRPTRLTKLIQLNIANLAGVPSIVYGILGFTVFTRMFGIFGSEKKILALNFLLFHIDVPLPLGPALLSGACTLALLSLPVVIISSQEALRSVPASLRHASYALGATKWQTISHQVLPAALPGILTGVILSLSRAIGEAAPLALIGVAAQLSYTPGRIESFGDFVRHPDKLLKAPFDRFTALPIQIFSWINEASPNFEHVAAAGILVLLATLLTMNGAAIFIRQRFQQKIRW